MVVAWMAGLVRPWIGEAVVLDCNVDHFAILDPPSDLSSSVVFVNRSVNEEGVVVESSEKHDPLIREASDLVTVPGVEGASPNETPDRLVDLLHNIVAALHPVAGVKDRPGQHWLDLQVVQLTP